MAATPKRTYTGSITYMFPSLEIGTLEIAGNFRTIGPMGYLPQRRQWNNSANSRYTVYGARVALYDAFGISGLQLALVGSNVTDRSYVTNGVPFGSETNPIGFTVNTFGDPRHFVFEAAYEF